MDREKASPLLRREADAAGEDADRIDARQNQRHENEGHHQLGDRIHEGRHGRDGFEGERTLLALGRDADAETEERGPERGEHTEGCKQIRRGVWPFGQHDAEQRVEHDRQHEGR